MKESVEFSGGGQGNAPKPPEKKQGTQHRQREIKIIPKLIIRKPFQPKKKP